MAEARVPTLETEDSTADPEGVNDIQLSQLHDQSNPALTNLCVKRKLTESLSPEKAKIYQNLMSEHSPDNSLIIYSDHKRRVYETSPNEISHAETNNVNTKTVDSRVSSDGYDTEDNRPLSQLTKQPITDNENPQIDENNLVYTPQLPKRRVIPLHTRLLRAKNRGQDGSGQSTENTDVDVAKPPKQNSNMIESTVEMFKKLEASIANLTLQGEQSKNEIAQINVNIAKISANMVSPEELKAAINDVTEAYVQDKKTMDEALKSQKLNLDIIQEDLRESVVVHKKKASDLELMINEAKLTQLLHQEKMSDKLSQLENEMQHLKNRTTKEKDIPQNTQASRENRDHDTKKSIIIEGLSEYPNEDIYQSVIVTIKQVGLKVFENDIDLAYRIGAFKGPDAWPRPVRVILVSERVKLHIMENREMLQNSQTHFNVRLVRDEPKEKRVARAILRKGTQRARERGCHVVKRTDSVEINGKLFNLDNAQEIDKTYKDALMTPGNKDNPNPKRKSKPAGRTKLPCEREAEKWLAFYTEESIYSSFYKVPVTYRNVTYPTLEHGYQATHALECNDLEAYTDILKASTAAEAKGIGGRIPFSEHWETVKGPHMEDLQYAKFTQHPELRKKLCSTVGKALIEASKDRYWGAGVLINSPALDSQRFGGRNELGNRIGNARTRILTEQLTVNRDTLNKEIDMEVGTSLHSSTPSAGAESTQMPKPMSVARPAQTSQAEQRGTGEPKRSLPANTAAHSESIEVLEEGISPPRENRISKLPLSPKVYYKEGVIEV